MTLPLGFEVTLLASAENTTCLDYWTLHSLLIDHRVRSGFPLSQLQALF